MLLDPNNYNSGDGDYQPGQQYRNSYTDSQLTDDDSYQSQNPQQDPELTDDDSYQSNNAGSSLELDDNDSYKSQNEGNFNDPEYLQAKQKIQSKENKPGLSQNLKDFASGKLQQKVGGKAVDKIGEAAGLSPELMGGFGKDTTENREKVKELAKERAREAIKNKFEGKGGEFGKQFGDAIGKGSKGIYDDIRGKGDKAEKIAKGAKDATNVAKGAKDTGALAKDAKNVANVAKGAKEAAAVAKGAKAAATGIEAVKDAIAVAGAASGPETLGLGTLAAFLLDIAISLGIEDAVDMMFELKAGNLKKANFHAQKAYMSIGMFAWFLIGTVFSISAAGFFIGIPIMFGLTLYMIAGMIFPNIGLLQGLSRWWEQGVIIFIDLILIIILLVFLAGIFFYICQESGFLTGGLVKDLAVKAADWYNGTDYASTFNEACKSIKSF